MPSLSSLLSLLRVESLTSVLGTAGRVVGAVGGVVVLGSGGASAQATCDLDLNESGYLGQGDVTTAVPELSSQEAIQIGMHLDKPVYLRANPEHINDFDLIYLGAHVEVSEFGSLKFVNESLIELCGNGGCDTVDLNTGQLHQTVSLPKKTPGRPFDFGFHTQGRLGKFECGEQEFFVLRNHIAFWAGQHYHCW